VTLLLSFRHAESVRRDAATQRPTKRDGTERERERERERESYVAARKMR
jgi:hypothetical protein